MRLDRRRRLSGVANTPDKAFRRDLGNLREVLPDGRERGRKQRGVLGIVDPRDTYLIRHRNTQFAKRLEQPGRLVVVAASDGINAKSADGARNSLLVVRIRDGVRQALD